jgi:hypothetical protein
MGARNVYIIKADIVEKYVVGEYVGKEREFKERGVFPDNESFLEFLGRSDYISELKKRGEKRVIFHISAKDSALIETIKKELENSGFTRIKKVTAKLHTNNP